MNIRPLALLSSLLLSGVFSLSCAALYTWRAESRYAVELASRVDREASALQALTLSSEAMGATQLAGLLNNEIRQAASQAGSAPLVAREALKALAESVDSRHAFVANAQGLITSDWDAQGRDVLGEKVSHRPYFSTAMAGRKNLAALISQNTGQRMFYVAAPVRQTREEGSPVIGVVAVRFEMEMLDRFLGAWPDTSGLLVSPDGIVMASNTPALQLRALGLLPPERQAALKASHRYGSLPDALSDRESLPMFDSTRVHMAGKAHSVAQARINWNDPGGELRLILVGDLDARIPLLHRLIAGLIALVVALLSCALFFSRQRDRRLRQQHAQQQARQYAFQQALIDTMPYPVFYKGADSAYLGINQAYEEAFGVTRANLIGKRSVDLDFLPETERQHYQAESEVVIQNASRIQRETTLVLRDGQTHDMLYLLSGFHYADGATGGMVGTLVDITPLKAAERAMSQARLAAESATRMKSEFLANMSHEIRTPMNAIIGMAHLAMQSELPPKERGYVEKIDRAANNLLGIINDILDFSKIEAGKLSVEQTAFRLDDVFANLASLLEFKAQEKGLAFVVDVAPGTGGLCLQGDPLRLGQVLLNLGGNALKFTERGEVRISAQLETLASNRVRLRCDVRDSGIGMDSEQCARLFQSFSQADTSITRRFGGTGLGLAISRNLIELMGGEIGVESHPGEGSRFYFSLPLDVLPADACGAPKEAAASATEARAQLAGARLLLVEDNEMNRELALELLGRAGIELVCAENGQVALDILARDRAFDGILMDCQMPVLDGYETTRRLRAAPLGLQLPVIAMTASALAQDQGLALAAGMNDYLAKPLNIERMFQTLARWIHPAQPTIRTTMPTAEQVLPEIPGIDRSLALSHMGGDGALLQRMLASFARSHANWLEDSQRALAAADLASLRRLAHTLKGTAGSIGAVAVAQAAGQLEAAATSGGDWSACAALHEALAIRLPPLLQALAQPLPPTPEGTGRPMLARDELLRKLGRLQALIKESDAEATDLADELATQLQGTAWQAGFAPVSAALAQIDFDRASAALQPLLAELHSLPN